MLFHVFVSGKFATSWKERLVLNPPPLPDKRRIIHIQAASVGETIALAPVTKALRSGFPEHIVLVSTLSETGNAAAYKHLDADIVTYLPLDYPLTVARFFRHFHPDALILMETELWPNLVTCASGFDIPVFVINGRIRPTMVDRYRLFGFVFKTLFSKIEFFAAQSEADAERAKAIGMPAEKVFTAGNVKYDQIASNPGDPRLTQIRRSLAPPGDRVIIAGSTHPGEHDRIIRRFARYIEKKPETFLIVAPRHPVENARVEKLLQGLSLSYLKRSEQSQTNKPWTSEIKVLLLDTMGELAFFYDLASLAFVGGTLIPVGGHSPLEPAVFCCPVLFGPYTETFEEITNSLLNAGAAERVISHDELWQTIDELLDDRARARKMGERARRVVLAKSGAAKVVIERIKGVLNARKTRQCTQ